MPVLQIYIETDLNGKLSSSLSAKHCCQYILRINMLLHNKVTSLQCLLISVLS